MVTGVRTKLGEGRTRGSLVTSRESGEDEVVRKGWFQAGFWGADARPGPRVLGSDSAKEGHHGIRIRRRIQGDGSIPIITHQSQPTS